MATSQVMSVPTGQTGRQETLSEWAGPYVTSMLGKTAALAETPYQTYQGPLTAGASPLQMQAFQGIGGLRVPDAVGQAATDALSIGQAAKGMSFTPGSFTNAFAAPAEYKAGTFDAGFNFAPGRQATDFTNQFIAPEQYKAGTFSTGTFGTQQAQQFMNPYLQTALEPTLAEMRRQSDIARLSDAARLTQAGAFGGSRQAIMESEARRNLLEKQRQTIGEGYTSAFDRAMAQFNAEEARRLEAQKAEEASRQFGAGQSLTAAQERARFGLEALRGTESARQFDLGQQLAAAQEGARMRLDAQRAAEASRQFGAGQAMTAAQEAARYGLDAARMGEQSRQFGAQYGLDALNRQMEAARLGSTLGLAQSAEQRALMNQMLEAGTLQRAIESEGVKADLEEFERQRAFPYQQLQFQQSMLQGMPIQSIAAQYAQPTTLASTLNTAGGLMDLYERLFNTGTKTTGGK